MRSSFLMIRQKRLAVMGLVLLFSVFQAGASSSTAPNLDEALARAQVMISQGDNEQAYALLRPYEIAGSGNINFNYLFGLAALDSGRPSEAIFALQRAVQQDPDYSAARMELARAYFELRDYEAARIEFEALQQQDPPPRAKVAITNYLAAIRRESRRYRPGFGYYFQAGLGYDSNANGATDVDQFLIFRLDEQSRAQSSGYVDIGYGGHVHAPINRWYQAVAQIGINHRRLPSADFVDQDRVRASAGFRFDDDFMQMTTLLVASYNQLDSDVPWDGDFNSKDLGLEVGVVTRTGHPDWRFLGNLRLARVDYRNNISVQDVDQALLSLGLEWAENRGKYRRLGGQVILGNESARESNSPYGRTQLGLRLFGSRQLTEKTWLLGQGGLLASDYDGRFFGLSRDDRLFYALAALAWRPFESPRWSLQPYIAYYDNNSDIEIFEYDRVQIGVTLTWSTE